MRMQDVNTRASVIPSAPPPPGKEAPKATPGQRAAEFVAQHVGSWRFIILQSFFLFAWVVLNTVSLIRHWDPYPFILMNLMLSLQAAYTAPMILMAQNRQADHDRKVVYAGYYISAHTNKKVRDMSEKIDNLIDLALEIKDQTKY